MRTRVTPKVRGPGSMFFRGMRVPQSVERLATMMRSLLVCLPSCVQRRIGHQWRKRVRRVLVVVTWA